MPFNELAQEQNKICPLCYGCGMEVVEGRGARPCVCVIAKRIQEHKSGALETIPPLYEGFSLENIVPDPSRHWRQQEAIRIIRENPNEKFAICGKYGCGKTHLLWALYRNQLESRRVYAGTLEEIIAEHKAIFEANKTGAPVPSLSITPEKFRQRFTPWTLFIDDIDKETPTEFVSKILFALLDAACNFNHQIVFTTNLQPAALIQHFERGDARFGGAIARRLLDNTKVIEMF